MLKLLVMYGNQPPSQEHVRRLMALTEDIQVVIADSETMAIRHAPDTEVILGHRLPMPPDLIYAQYPRLKADRALVSRVFLTPDHTRLNLKYEVKSFRHRMDEWYNSPDYELIQVHNTFREIAKKL